MSEEMKERAVRLIDKLDNTSPAAKYFLIGLAEGMALSNEIQIINLKKEDKDED